MICAHAAHMPTMKNKLLAAAKAESIPAGAKVLWEIRKINLAKDVIAPRDGKLIGVPAGSYTQLWRWTKKSLANFMNAGGDRAFAEPGELVMTDQPEELNTHLDFMLKAHGRVLITGLGLGCVIRGCLANNRVRHVVCIERDPHVLALVKPHMPTERLTILQADAIRWVKNNIDRQKFDCAWHDLWSDPDANEPHLQVNHAELFVKCFDHVGFQGAWAFPKAHKRTWQRHLGKRLI